MHREEVTRICGIDAAFDARRNNGEPRDDVAGFSIRRRSSRDAGFRRRRSQFKNCVVRCMREADVPTGLCRIKDGWGRSFLLAGISNRSTGLPSKTSRRARKCLRINVHAAKDAEPW